MDVLEEDRIQRVGYQLGIVLSNLNSDYADFDRKWPSLGRYVREHAARMFLCYPEVWESQVHFAQNYINVATESVGWNSPNPCAWYDHAHWIRRFAIGA